MARIYVPSSAPEEEPVGEAAVSDLFDPAEHTADEVNAHLDAHSDDADEVQRVLDAEAEGKARKSVIEGPHAGS